MDRAKRDATRGRVGGNAFDLGPAANMEAVFGTSSLLRALLPTLRGPEGDGHVFRVRGGPPRGPVSLPGLLIPPPKPCGGACGARVPGWRRICRWGAAGGHARSSSSSGSSAPSSSAAGASATCARQSSSGGVRMAAGVRPSDAESGSVNETAQLWGGAVV